MSEAAIDAGATDQVDTPVDNANAGGSVPAVDTPDKASISVVTGDGTNPEGTDEPVTAPADWPEDWRQKLVGDDEKALKRLERYKSPADVSKALFAAQQKISSGELKSAKPENASPEEIAKWRKDNGIPDSPDKYDLALPDGLVIGENDKPIVDEVLKAAHEADASPAVVQSMVSTFYKMQDMQAAQQAEQDAAFKAETEDALRSEWGNEYRRNLNQVEGFLGGLPNGLGARLAMARLSDGRPLGADPDAVAWLAQQAREANPLASVMGNDPGDKGQALSDEIASLETMMGDRKSEYWKGPKAESLQARYRELVTVREKVKS